MQSELEIISKELLQKQLSIIPHSHRTQFITMIKEAQKDIEHKSYDSEAGAGSIKLTVGSDGTLKDLVISEHIFEELTHYSELNKTIKDLIITAHKKATNMAKKDIAMQIKNLESKINLLTKDIINNLNESNTH